VTYAVDGAVGTARASELIILSTPFTAEDALSWGTVGRLVPAGELGATADHRGTADAFLAKQRPEFRGRE
jgi:enoyl-CoA hydratase/carnithine racemase